MAASFSPEREVRIRTLLGRYPEKRAACLPILFLAQEELGYIGMEAEELVARTLDLPLAEVHGVATFYSMFRRRPLGKFHIQVCTNVSCQLCGSREVLQHVERRLGISVGGTTPDGLFSLSEVECLAHCGTAPALQVNDEVCELASPDRVDELLEQLRSR